MWYIDFCNFTLSFVCIDSVFVGELEQCTSSGATPGIHGVLAVLHILHALAKGN